MKRRRIAKPELSPDVAAIDRLRKAGASGNAAIRQRIALVAAERNLNTPGIGCRLPTYRLITRNREMIAAWFVVIE
jgi:hypothetical protein